MKILTASFSSICSLVHTFDFMRIIKSSINKNQFNPAASENNEVTYGAAPGGESDCVHG